MKISKYIAKSSIIGILTTRRFNLLFARDGINLDIDRKEIVVLGSNSTQIDLSKLIDVESVHHRHCSDIVLETHHGRHVIKCLETRISRKIKYILQIMIWERSLNPM